MYFSSGNLKNANWSTLWKEEKKLPPLYYLGTGEMQRRLTEPEQGQGAWCRPSDGLGGKEEAGSMVFCVPDGFPGEGGAARCL